MPRAAIAGVALNVLALGCIVVSFLTWNDVTVEGAYFNRSVGGTEQTVAVYGPAVEPWLIAAAVLLITGTFLLLRAVRRQPQRA